MRPKNCKIILIEFRFWIVSLGICKLTKRKLYQEHIKFKFSIGIYNIVIFLTLKDLKSSFPVLYDLLDIIHLSLIARKCAHYHIAYHSFITLNNRQWNYDISKATISKFAYRFLSLCKDCGERTCLYVLPFSYF